MGEAKMSRGSSQELAAALRADDEVSGKAARGRLLDVLCQATG